MSNRLPIPGQDNGTWGDILNAYLEVSHNSDGTLNTSEVTSALPSPIPTTNLGSGTASSSNFLRGDGTWAVPSGAGNMNTSTYDPAGIAQQVVGLTAAQTLTNKSISGSQITSAVANATNATTASTVTTIPALTGDVTSSGSSNATTVAKLQGTTLSAPSGGATSYLNATGAWSTPSGSVTLDSTASDIKALGSQSAGSSSLASRADHVHPTTGLLLSANNLSDVSDAGTSRANIHIPSLTPAACVVTTNVSTMSGLNTYDGYTTVAGDLILLTGQSTTSQNGLWSAASGSWTRPTEMATGVVMKARTVPIIQGTTYIGTTWLLKTNSSITVDTTSQTWVQQLPGSVVTGASAGGVPAWAASTAYALNTLVTNGGTTYICTAAHTSGSTFSGESVDWQAIGGGVPSSVESGAPTLVTSAGTSLASGSRYLLDATLGPFPQPLPASPAAGAIVQLEAVTVVPKLVTVQGNGNLIEGQTNLTLGTKSSGAVFRAVELAYDGTFWRILDSVKNSWQHAQDHVAAGGGPIPLIPPPTDLTGTATIYIDAQNGSDSNAGTYLAPYKTLAHGVATAQGLAAGSIVALKCGSVFREALPCPITGSSGSPITVGQYGTGSRPKIKGSTDISNLAWTLNSGSIYQATSTAGTAVIYVDEMTPLVSQTSLANVTGPGEFYASGSTLYIWMPDGSSPAGHQLEQSGTVSTICNSGSSHSYWTVQDVAVMHSGTGIAGFYTNTGTTNWEIRRCQIGPMPGSACQCYGATWVHDCYVTGVWAGTEYPTLGGAPDGIGVYAAGTRINNNRVTDCCYGIRGISGGTSTAQIDHNLVYLNHVNGIDWNADTGAANIYNNTIWHRPTGPTAAGHGLDAQGGGSGVTAENNIVYSDYVGVGGAGNVEALCWENSGNTSDYNFVYITPASAAATYPCYPGKVGTTGGISTGPAANTGVYATWSTYQTAVVSLLGAGNDTHSIFGSDPLFVDMENHDFRLQPASPAIGGGKVVAGITNPAGVNFGAL